MLLLMIQFGFGHIPIFLNLLRMMILLLLMGPPCSNRCFVFVSVSIIIMIMDVDGTVKAHVVTPIHLVNPSNIYCRVHSIWGWTILRTYFFPRHTTIEKRTKKCRFFSNSDGSCSTKKRRWGGGEDSMCVKRISHGWFIKQRSGMSLDDAVYYVLSREIKQCSVWCVR